MQSGRMKPNRLSSSASAQILGTEQQIGDLGLDLQVTFVLKIWLEPQAQKSDGVTWRGHITHVLSREGQYVKNLGEINAYLKDQLQKIGVENIDIADSSASVTE